MHRSESFVVPEVSCEYQFPLKAPVRAGCVIMSEFSTAAYAGHLTWVLTGKGLCLTSKGLPLFAASLLAVLMSVFSGHSSNSFP